MKTTVLCASAAIGAILLVPAAPAVTAVMADGFDHEYQTLAGVLSKQVKYPRVDYAALKADRVALDRAVAEFDAPAARDESGWPRERRLAFWLNAYNAFTLRAIVDHYPIRGGWFTIHPRNSIRQIDGVWTDLTWRAAGRTVTLDGIEHGIIRPTFKDARIHYAVNCASISCPPLAAVPYRASTLDAQLDEAGRRFLASPVGLRVDGETLRVSSIFKWYGEDFLDDYAPLVPGSGDRQERAILGAIVKHGPAEAATLARTGRPAIRFLSYDWSLNDIE
ncbi:MAG: DUF547 domain-containing protein [Acidobacteria bacterium]|nr:DUF547 domain-containing protein [Acidobacteriota bacterium]